MASARRISASGHWLDLMTMLKPAGPEKTNRQERRCFGNRRRWLGAFFVGSQHYIIGPPSCGLSARAQRLRSLHLLCPQLQNEVAVNLPPALSTRALRCAYHSIWRRVVRRTSRGSVSWMCEARSFTVLVSTTSAARRLFSHIEYLNEIEM